MKTNFIAFKLCDNDFSYPLMQAVDLVAPEIENMSTEDLQFFATECLVFYSLIRRMPCRSQYEAQAQNTRNYLTKNLTVSRYVHRPDFDHDCGSVVFCLNTKTFWLQ